MKLPESFFEGDTVLIVKYDDNGLDHYSYSDGRCKFWSFAHRIWCDSVRSVKGIERTCEYYNASSISTTEWMLEYGDQL